MRTVTPRWLGLVTVSAWLLGCRQHSPTLLDVLEEFETEAGLAFASCGDGVADCEGALASPEFVETRTCLLAAWESCSPSRADLVILGLGGEEQVVRFVYVVPEEDGTCKLVLFEHRSSDPSDTIARRECEELLVGDVAVGSNPIAARSSRPSRSTRASTSDQDVR